MFLELGHRPLSRFHRPKKKKKTVVHIGRMRSALHVHDLHVSGKIYRTPDLFDLCDLAPDSANKERLFIGVQPPPQFSASRGNKREQEQAQALTTPVKLTTSST